MRVERIIILVTLIILRDLESQIEIQIKVYFFSYSSFSLSFSHLFLSYSSFSLCYSHVFFLPIRKERKEEHFMTDQRSLLKCGFNLIPRFSLLSFFFSSFLSSSPSFRISWFWSPLVAMKIRIFFLSLVFNGGFFCEIEKDESHESLDSNVYGCLFSLFLFSSLISLFLVEEEILIGKSVEISINLISFP